MLLIIVIKYTCRCAIVIIFMLSTHCNHKNSLIIVLLHTGVLHKPGTICFKWLNERFNRKLFHENILSIDQIFWKQNFGVSDLMAPIAVLHFIFMVGHYTLIGLLYWFSLLYIQFVQSVHAHIWRSVYLIWLFSQTLLKFS